MNMNDAGKLDPRKKAIEITKAVEKINSGTKVEITNIDMPFWSIVKLMIKVAIASIPAGIIIFLLYGILTTFVVSVLKG